MQSRSLFRIFKHFVGLALTCLVLDSYALDSNSAKKPIKSDYALTKEGSVKVTGGNIWYKIQGYSGSTPLIFIHGGPGGSSCSFTHLNKLGDIRPIIFYDQLGAGKSDRSNDQQLWNPDRFAQELHLLIETLHYPKVHLLGHSWGAAVAARYLAIYGEEKVESVIFVGPYLSSRDWTFGTRSLRKNLSQKSQAIFTRYEEQKLAPTIEYRLAEEEFYNRYLFRHPPKNSGACDENSWNQSIYETMWGDSEFFVSGTLKNFNATPILPQLKLPVLFLVGEFDESPEFNAAKYQAITPHAQLEVLKDAAHMSMVDQPENFMKAVNQFLAQVEHQH